MGNHVNNTDVDPQALENAQHMWGNFTVLVKISTVCVLLILSGMALFLL
jgi:hypothetical protein